MIFWKSKLIPSPVLISDFQFLFLITDISQNILTSVLDNLTSFLKRDRLEINKKLKCCFHCFRRRI